MEKVCEVAVEEELQSKTFHSSSLGRGVLDACSMATGEGSAALCAYTATSLGRPTRSLHFNLGHVTWMRDVV
jgi:hypothetical protein